MSSWVRLFAPGLVGWGYSCIKLKKGNVMDWKFCTKCDVAKPLEDFHQNKKEKDGKAFACKDCERKRRREYHKNNLERSREIERKSYRKNRDKGIERSREYRRVNAGKNRVHNNESALRDSTAKQALTSSLSTKSGKWSVKETQTLLDLIAQGETHLDIAIELGRDFWSVGTKVKNMRNKGELV